MRAFLGAVLAATTLSGCGSVANIDRNPLMGAGAGAGAGALVGWAVGGPPAAWVGAAVGSAAGGIIGYLIRPDGCYVQFQNGELWQVPCDNGVVRVAGCYVGNEVGGLRPVDCPSRTYLRSSRRKAVSASAAN